MSDGPPCAFCGEILAPAEPRVGIPDLMIEMHETCYRLHVEKRASADHRKC
jgi:hypothetical protein